MSSYTWDITLADDEVQVVASCGAAPDPGTWVTAVATWKHGSWPLISGSDAVWISNTYFIEGNISDSSWRYFRRIITLPSLAYDISGSIICTADNAEAVYVNGNLVGSDGEVCDPWADNHEWDSLKEYDMTNDLLPGENEILFLVRNYPGTNNPISNPTGLIYAGTITYSEPIETNIDIKPGSYPNSININGHGVIPVAILGSDVFDVMLIDPETLKFAGLDVAVKGKGALQFSYEDVSGDFAFPEGAPDGYVDLVVQFVDDPTAWTPEDGTATVTGQLWDGALIVGVDSIVLRPE